MKTVFSRIRHIGAEITDLWRDRDIHWPAFKAAIRSLPARFRQADRDQRIYLLILALLVLSTQIYFVMG